MAQFFILIAVLVFFEVLVVRYGADSRDGDDWVDHHHTHPGGASRRLPA